MIEQSPLCMFDKTYRNKGYNLIAGTDEAGRGPLAGPVVAACVILPEKFPSFDRLKDSKLIKPKIRKEICEIIKKEAIAYTIYSIDEDIIDRVNILEATKITIKNCIENISLKPDLVLVDGNFKIPGISIKQEAIIKGDNLSAVIAAASILAKVARDNLMDEFDIKYPEYGFAKHKGYGTALHIEMLKKHGPCKIHRKTFKPVSDLILQRSI